MTTFLERLKALDAMMTRGTWEADGYQITTLVGLIAETNHEPNAEGIAFLRNCLPEFIALVEAAKWAIDAESAVLLSAHVDLLSARLDALDAKAEEQQK